MSLTAMNGKMRCPACARGDLSVFLEIESVPVHCNLLWASREAALEVARGAIRLGFCPACGMISNVAFDPHLVSYAGRYENSLDFSPRFQQYALGLVDRLVRRYRLRGKQIIEIGAGRGEFLAALCEAGANHGLGFDPSYDGDSSSGPGAERVTMVRDAYSPAYSDFRADFICCRQTLEHVQEPRQFLLDLQKGIGQQPTAGVFFEVPNAMYMLRNLAVWDILYEHCSYFAEPSLAAIFRQTDFSVRDMYTTYGGQFLCLEGSRQVPTALSPAEASADLEKLSGLVWTFGDRFWSKVGRWNRRVRRWLGRGRRVVVWGGGSKGVMFLNIVEACRDIEHVVDINPRKLGMYVAGTGQSFVGPRFLREYQPDVVILMNRIYRSEVAQLLEQERVGARVVVA